MNELIQKYNYYCQSPSDINEHLPTLYQYAQECESVIELGVRGVISSYALINGLMNNNKQNKKILLNDISPCDINELLSITNNLPIEVNYKWINDLDLDIRENVDLTFIDTWHVYGHLKRELDKFSKVTNKYIIMHDTTVDEWHGETIRCGWNAEQQSKETCIPVNEINKGLWPAIEEFLVANKNWKIKERFTHNNGLTILEKL
jgi:hypothetical protein|tara:strand:+ start:502 stop:1113 length:612 start_codon:yes stop_codon:yes gene_type:complete